MHHLTFTAQDQDRGARLDRFLTALSPDLSRARIQTLIKAGHVQVNGAIVNAPNHRIQPGECVRLELPAPEPAAPKPEAIPLDIVYEDSDILVIDKPSGLVVHPAAGNWSGTLVNAVIAHCGDSLSGIGGVRRPGIVHRLDKDTSGLIVVAKNDRAHRRLKAQFADHGRTGPLLREYEALVWGGPVPAVGTIRTHIARHPTHRLRFAVTRERGREAVTHYRTLTTYQGPAPDLAPKVMAARVSCRLETGRTHQIRVHMAHIGHPVIGDPLYAAGFATRIVALPENLQSAILSLNGQALHATRLSIDHPTTGEHLSFTSELPQDMRDVIAALTADGAACA